jgi:hypothetical protein
MRKIKLGVLGILVVLFALSIFTILRTPPTNKNWEPREHEEESGIVLRRRGVDLGGVHEVIHMGVVVACERVHQNPRKKMGSALM